jgi:secreted trypsin-like serine protease
MPGILSHQRASDANAKLRLPFIIYFIIILFQALSIRVLADKLVSANAMDPKYSYIPSKTVNARIVGGEPATDGEFPYMVAIYLKGYLRCGGVILSSRWVLTGAFCVVNPNGTHTSTTFEIYGQKSDYAVGYGSIRNETLNWVSISTMWFPSQYNPQDVASYNNLALIELATPLPSNGAWRPVRITSKIVKSGDKLITAGWGHREDGENSSILQKIQLTAGTYSECQHRSWNGHDGKFVCTSSGRGRGLCFGDGGGPLVLPDSPNSDEDFAGYLVGIDSFFVNANNPESDECSDGDPTLNYFTRLAKYVDWIANAMGVDSSELLATPKTESDDDRFSSVSDDDDDDDDYRPGGGKFRFRSSAVSFPMKSFDDMLRLMTLCLLALVSIIISN